jgi:carboxyl-terminal processing protease
MNCEVCDNAGMHDSQNQNEHEENVQLKQERPRRSLLGIGLAVLLAVSTFFSGLHMGSDVSLEASLGSLFRPETQADTSIDLSEFWKVWDILDTKFVSSTTTDALSREERIRGAIGGLVDSYGDPYTVYMPPADASAFAEEISGNFSGVGMEVGMRDGLVTVITPLPNTPAEKAGILAGDTLIKIDDFTTEDMSTDEAVRRIRGEEGTEVRLTIFRKGDTEFREFSIKRATIVIPTSKIEERDGVFIIALYSFNALAEIEMQNALRAFVRSGKEKLIIDLRGNPGGYLESAVSIASYFLPVGKVVVRENFGEAIEEQLYRSSGRELGNRAPKKMVVLIDGGSASAAEILAGALKEHGVATVIGETTFGKGSVQELIELEDGSSLKITIARWLTPNGNSISDGGLAPDIEVKRTQEDRTNNTDPQLEAAIEFLNK